MLRLRIAVDAAQAARLEAYFCEEYQQSWLLDSSPDGSTQALVGYFDDAAALAAGEALVRAAFPDLAPQSEVSPVVDQDWKEAYKLHFKPWSDRGLHWVPVWERDHYPLPPGDEIVYLDPGMAFGTGNHETTRLCVRRLLDARDARGGSLAGVSVVDAGCGSGILAISAAKLGCAPILGFDNDPDAVTISIDNARLCGVEDAITFRWAGLPDGLESPCDVLMANILANVLCVYDTALLDAVKPGGHLILSGILAKEGPAIRDHFTTAACRVWGTHGLALTDQRFDGDWADVLLVRAPAQP
jgi:ribosomal protein L11 methyltransferase